MSPSGLHKLWPTLVHVHIATEVLESPSWDDWPVSHDKDLVGDIDRIS